MATDPGPGAAPNFQASFCDGTAAARPHVLIFPYPVQGHLIPMMQLSLKLSSFGISVTFVTTQYRLSHLLRAANQTPPPVLQSSFLTASAQAHETITHMASTPNIGLVGLHDGLPADNDRNPLSMLFVHSVDHCLPGELEALLRSTNTNTNAAAHQLERRGDDDDKPISSSSSITCIISDSFLPWTQDVANRWNIPRVFFWTQSMAVAAAYANIPRLGYDPFALDVRSRGELHPFMVTSVPGLPAIDPYDLPFNGAVKGSEAAQWLSAILHHQFSRINEAHWVIANSMDELERSVVEALKPSIPKLLLMGPLHMAEGNAACQENYTIAREKFRACLWKEDEDCMAWLDTRATASVLFISFGSVVTQTQEEMREIAVALVGMCSSKQQPNDIGFLWACRSAGIWESCRDGGVFPPEFWEEVEGGTVKLVSWAPQLAVLSHPAVGAFLSHAGWNSTLESLSLGVPLISCPDFLDQFTNCWSVAYQWKAGLEIHKKQVSAAGAARIQSGEVENAIRTLMMVDDEKGAELRRAAASIGAAARKAWAPDGPSTRNVNRLVQFLFASLAPP